ncbi:hypothetical protein BV22DRAFT_1129038 [Leucogyrophana mollusca]|uniref:Uncharacterized protein n=1 Tax=Leucogyrophana mollusca TaxID=85980 RepID=A0ACB8BJB6_9AGAM|nr:hypothetical protein BV22DRAFT_1129038 [Leucogyrophana mollusca]
MLKRRRCKSRSPSVSQNPGSNDSDVVLQPDSYEPGPSRYMKFWFEDGTIVLRVEICLFRVHRPILSSHSQTFRRFFGLPDLYHGEIMMGCPVIYLQGNSAHFIHLLMTLYQPFYFRGFSYSFDLVSTILHLGTKYASETCAKRHRQPQAWLSLTLESFDDPTHALLARDHGWDNVIKVDTECFEILPRALYSCTRLPTSMILQGDGLRSLSWVDI